MNRSLILLVSLVSAVFIAGAEAPASPPKASDETPMVDGRVRTLAQVGTNIWVGGDFAQVKQHDGTTIDDVSNVAVFDSATGDYVDIAPKLGDEGSAVWDMEVYGDDVVIAGDFAGPGAKGANLVLVDGTTGAVIRWYDSAVLRSALAAPGLGRIYGGGKSLSAFDVVTGENLWTGATEDEQYGAREMLLDAEVEGVGPVKMPGLVPKLSATPGAIGWYGGALGAHNEEVYGGLLGLSGNEIGRLAGEGAV